MKGGSGSMDTQEEPHVTVNWLPVQQVIAATRGASCFFPSSGPRLGLAAKVSKAFGCFPSVWWSLINTVIMTYSLS